MHVCPDAKHCITEGAKDWFPLVPLVITSRVQAGLAIVDRTISHAATPQECEVAQSVVL